MGKVKVLSHNVITPFGEGSHENFLHIKAGETAIRQHKGQDWGLTEDFMAALIDKPVPSPRAEHLALSCIQGALSTLPHSIPKDEMTLVLCTTKGNVESIHKNTDITLSHMATSLQKAIGLKENPIVVSNACTSGLCGLIEGMRILKCGHSRYVIVCGVEAQSRFIVSGFQSFHALSPDHCMPFSANRIGLNVGEAAATMILTLTDEISPEDWILAKGAIRNDAFHISGPSHQAEGSFRALRYVMDECSREDLAFVSVHGTATPFNDEMEAVALHRAGLSDVPIFSLKGYYGHTMGAAGVLETILSMEAVDAGIVPATLGYDGELGVSKAVNVSQNCRTTQKKTFIKLMSGFGGCNAALRLQKSDDHRPTFDSSKKGGAL